MIKSKPYGKTVFWYFMAFFVFITAVLATMVTIAVRTNTGIVTDHPYEKGLAYNDVVNAEQKQNLLGWKSNVLFTQSGLKTGMLNFTVSTGAGQGIVADKVFAEIRRPTQAGMDFTVPMIANAAGYEAKIEFPSPGLWEVRIYVQKGEARYQTVKRVVLQ